MKFVLLAAGKGSRIYNKINKNKCLLKLAKKTLIERSVGEILKTKIKNIIIVLGFKPKQIIKTLNNHKNVTFIFNKQYKSREMLYSLILALKKYNTNLIFGYSDIIFTNKIIDKLIKKNSKNITIPVLSNWKKIWKIRKKNPMEDAETLYTNKFMQITSIGKKINDLKSVKYQFMGITFIPRSQRRRLLNCYSKIKKKKSFTFNNLS